MDSNEQKKSDGFFAKIPTIYLELHHFNFSHGAYQSDSQRFLGRDEIRNRVNSNCECSNFGNWKCNKNGNKNAA